MEFYFDMPRSAKLLRRPVQDNYWPVFDIGMGGGYYHSLIPEPIGYVRRLRPHLAGQTGSGADAGGTQVDPSAARPMQGLQGIGVTPP